MKRCWFLIVFAVLFITCKEAYNPPVTSSATGYLVVEGFINSGNGISTITLTRTTKLVDSVAKIYEDGAQVYIEDEGGANYPLNWRNNGTYISDTLSLDPASKYRLHINTSNGNEYVSDFTAVKNTPPVDSISWQLKNGGVQIYVNSHDPSNNTKYYQLKYSETWEFHSPFIKYLDYVKDPANGELIGVAPLPNADTSIYKCWRTQNPAAIILISTEKLSESKVLFPIRYIEPQADELSVLYYIEVKQYALSEGAFLFKEKLKKNTEQLGSIFDAQPSELGGNIHCISNPSELVIGFVDVTTEQVAKLFIRNSELANWPLVIPCTKIIVENKPENYNVGLVPLTVYAYIGMMSIKSYYAADPLCVDCTLRGTNIRPPFWP
jgi:hypothetical protein